MENIHLLQKTELAGGENVGNASPSTETLGNATPFNILPQFITIKMWKRLS